MTYATQAKRVTTTLNKEARARLVDFDEERYQKALPSSPSLSDLVHRFLEEEDCPNACQDFAVDQLQPFCGNEGYIDHAAEVSMLLTDGGGDSYREGLQSLVRRSMGSSAGDKAVLRRQMVGFLRENGHNAGICKTQWETASDITGGGYEFIDIVTVWKGQPRRYVVDLDFAAQFEIARPTAYYSRLCRMVPSIYVGKLGENLKRIIRVMCDATRRSLMEKDLAIPPWRKNRYMINKWFCSYHRDTAPTTNETPVQKRLTTIL